MWQWNPDPFGNGDPVGSFTYELRFPGQFFDQATRLHYNYFRDYDPRTGRYIESDPIGLLGGINTYAYADGNPLAMTDASGLATGGFSPIPDTSASACEAPPDDWDKLLDIDTATCNGITRMRGKRAGAICHASAAERYAECLRYGISGVKTPLSTWNN